MSRKTNLFVALSVVIVISASVGFYELGLSRGEATGYQNGLSDGFHSVLIQMLTEVGDFQPDQSLLVYAQPLNANYVILSYSFSLVEPSSQNNTVEMCITVAGEAPLFSTGYHSNDTSYVNLSTQNITSLSITFKANPSNTEAVVLEFTSPLRMTFN